MSMARGALPFQHQAPDTRRTKLKLVRVLEQMDLSQRHEYHELMRVLEDGR